MVKLLVGLVALVFFLPVLVVVLALAPLLLLVLLPLCLVGLGLTVVLGIVAALVALPFKLLGCLCSL